jgi:hypothetical protein
LVPPRDSTAYIIDQFVLPTDKDMTTTSRRLIHYHIGFTDLPAVKILIPCNKVLDYVSPRELEDWEYQNLEKKEEERARLLAEKQRAGPKKKKPGRPTKVPMEDVGMPMLSSADEALLLAQQVAGPSLSTPQKRKLGRIPNDEEIGDSNAESDDAAIHRQLQGEDGSEGVAFDDDMDMDSESVDQLALQYDTPVVDTPSRASSLARPAQESFPIRPAVTPLEAALPGSITTAAVQPNINPTPGAIHPAWAQAFGQQTPSEKPSLFQRHNGHAQQNGTPWALLAKSQQAKHTSSGTSNNSNGPSRVSTSGAGVTFSAPSDSSARKRKDQAPNGKGSSQTQQKPKKQKVEQQVEPAAEEWEVKDLLDDQWFIEQGVKVHRYLVLWEGDWPEDQNPTWEPADNVQDQGLINRYQKKKKAGLLKPRKKAQKTLHQYLAGARYSSVAEAFEGGIDEQTGQVAADMEGDADPPDETFLVTENVGDITANGTKPAPTPSFGSFDSMLARYNQSFPRG